MYIIFANKESINISFCFLCGRYMNVHYFVISHISLKFFIEKQNIGKKMKTLNRVQDSVSIKLKPVFNCHPNPEAQRGEHGFNLLAFPSSESEWCF